MGAIEGIVFLAQGDRFQVLDKEGLVHRFVISRSSSLVHDHTYRQQRTGARVRVFCTQSADPLESMAHAVTRIDTDHFQGALLRPEVNRRR